MIQRDDGADKHGSDNLKRSPHTSSRAEARDLIAKLGELYPPPAWTMLSEVRNTTGTSDVVGYADALAVRMLPAHGPWSIHGFEAKRTRADWLVELSKPAKSAMFRRYCERWYLVVPAPWKSVVLSIGELPDGWGLIEAGSGSPVFVHEPEATETEEPPIEFVRAMLRAASAIPVREAESGAHMQPVSRVLRSSVALACGHVVPYLGKDRDRPARLPCAGCAAELPIDVELAEFIIAAADAEDLEHLAVLIERASAVPVAAPPPVRRAGFGRAGRHHRT